MDKSKYLRLTAALIVFIINIGISNSIIAQDIHISTNTTWSTSNLPPLITGDIIIERYVVLTIQTGVTLKMPENSSIKVLEGAKINSNGATIKQLNNSWYGIFADGQGSSISQLSTQQPKITLVNTKIEKMVVGISNSLNPNGGSIYGGGVIRLYNCILTNCKNGVVLKDYVYYNGGVVKKDLSFVKKTRFTNSVATNSTIGIVMDNVVGIRILGCQFDNILNAVSGVESSYLIDDLYSLNGSLSSSSYFSNNHIAVVIHGSNALLGKIIVRNTDFSNSSTAVLSLSADYCEIYSNNISVNQDVSSTYACGIYLELTPNFYVEGNVITGVSYGNSFPDNTYGIIVNSSGENNNSIYGNIISHCEYNIFGFFKNRGNVQGSGLLFTCNNLSETPNNSTSNYSQHTYYIYSDAYSGSTNPLYSVNMMQGGGAYDPSSSMFVPSTASHNIIPKRLYLSTGNEFDFYTNHLSLNPPSDILYMQPAQGSTLVDEYINYYTTASQTGSYYHGITPMYEAPPLPSLQTCPIQIPQQKLFNINASVEVKIDLMQNVSTAKQAFANYENDGDYSFMYNIATNITPSNNVTAYYYLMNSHPGYDILAYAVGDDDLPNYMVRDILITNSYGIKNQLVRDALKQRQTILTSTQLNDINISAQSISQFEEYQMEISTMLANLQNTKMQINRYYHQTDTNEVDISRIIDDLNNTDDFYSHYSLMLYYFKIGDLNLAQDHFNIAMSDDIIDNKEKIQLDILFKILDRVYKNLDGDFLQVSQKEIDELTHVSRSYTKSSGTAKVILINNFDYEYEPEYIEPSISAERLSKGVDIINNKVNNDIIITPNPASMQFGLILSKNVKYPLKLDIFDISGKLVIAKDVNCLSTISTQGLKPGIYNLKIVDANNKTYLKKLIIK